MVKEERKRNIQYTHCSASSVCSWRHVSASTLLPLLHFIQITCCFITTGTPFLPLQTYTSKVQSTTLFVDRKTIAERNLTMSSHENHTGLVDFGNFWRKTQANFTSCERPSHDPLFVSKSGSAYWDLGNEVVRLSNHWTGQNGISKIVDCYWTIDIEHDNKEFVCGRCQYVDFIPRKKIKKPSNNKKPKGFGT